MWTSPRTLTRSHTFFTNLIRREARSHWQIIRHSSWWVSGSWTCSGAHVAIPDGEVCWGETAVVDGHSRGGHARARSDGLSQTG
jgi:hypothetical protein